MDFPQEIQVFSDGSIFRDEGLSASESLHIETPKLVQPKQSLAKAYNSNNVDDEVGK